jgi:hypothetical protein
MYRYILDDARIFFHDFPHWELSEEMSCLRGLRALDFVKWWSEQR